MKTKEHICVIGFDFLTKIFILENHINDISNDQDSLFKVFLFCPVCDKRNNIKGLEEFIIN